MLEALEYFAAIGAFAFEHGACVMQAMREHADFTIGGRNEFAVEPDQIGTLVEWHCHGIASLRHGWPDPAGIFRRIIGWALRSGLCFSLGLLRPDQTSGKVAFALCERPFGALPRRAVANQARCGGATLRLWG